MRFLNYCLGALANLNAALARQRINGIPLNALLMLGAAIYSAVLWHSALDALQNSHSPQVVSIDQIMTGQGVTQNYVSVPGWSVPAAVYQYAAHDSTGEATKVTESWSPLVDLETKHVLLVRHAGPVPPGDPHLATVTGMLRSLHAEVRHWLADHGNKIDGQPTETQYALEEGDYPGDAGSAVVAATFVSLLFGCLCIVSFRRNTVFQEESCSLTPPVSASARQSIPVWATGRFSLDAVTAQRFVDVLAVLALDRGCPVLASRIDASYRFMGVISRERSGVWHMFVNPATVKDGRLGFFYFGLSRRRRAFRFSYVDPRDGKHRKAVIATDEPNDVLIAAAMLTGVNLSGTVPEPT